MKKSNKKIQKKFLIFSLVGCSLLLILTGILLNSYALTEPVKSISFTSKSLNYQEKEPGSFKVQKKAEWTSFDTAKITFNVDTTSKVNSTDRDIILVLNLSDSMEQRSKMDILKSAACNLVNSVLENSENRVAVVGIGTNASIISEFSNDATQITNRILAAEKSGSRNHYGALVKVDQLLWNYKEDANRELMAVIVTDGFAEKGTPNEFFQYDYLKNQYPFLKVKTVQFDFGDMPLPYMQKMSDEQYVATLTDLESVLKKSVELPVFYDKFELSDWINPDYFSVESVSSIKSSAGKAKLVDEDGTQKIVWDLGNFRTGEHHELTINLNLKPEFHDGTGMYPTNSKEAVSYKLETVEETVTSTDTPILSSHYSVTYDVNEPTGCSVSEQPETKKYRPLSVVKINDDDMSCSGYQFSGWKIVNTGVENNGNYFEMPESDVRLVAEWSKLSIVKSMDGNLNQKRSGYLTHPDNTEANDKIWKYKKDVTKVVFENYIHSHHSEVEVFDLSQNGSGAIMGRVVANAGGTTYTVYIQGDEKIVANSTSFLFAGFSKLQTIEGMEYLDTSEIADMNYMFYGCSSLQSLDLSHFKTSTDSLGGIPGNRHYMVQMVAAFEGCSSLKTLDLSTFDTSQVVDMNHLFKGCTNLESVNLSSFNTMNLHSARSMFQDCESLKELDLSNFEHQYMGLGQVDRMFYNCHSLEKLNLGKLNPYGDFTFMFAGCYKLKELDLSGFTSTFAVSNLTYTFSECYALTSLDLSNFNTQSVTTMRGTFSNCSNLQELKINPDTFTTAQVSDMGEMFSGCEHLLSLDVSKFDTANVIDMSLMFNQCNSLTSLDVSKFVTSKVKTMALMFSGCSSISSLDVSQWNTASVISMNNLFDECRSLTSLDVSSWDTSNATDMSVMFRRCSSLSVLDVSHFNTAQVVDMNNMFDGCSSLESLEVGNFDTTNVRGMSAMFAYCQKVPSLDVSRFVTSKVEDMSYMFSECNALTVLNVSGFDTSKVKDMQYMFNRCSALPSLDVSHFDTSNVTNMSVMFGYMNALLSLDVSHFNTSNVTDMSYMFDSLWKISSLDISSFDTSKVTNMDNMFNECYMLGTLKGTLDTRNARSLNNLFSYCYYLNATVNINCATTVGFNKIFYEVATEAGAPKLTVNYTAATSSLADQMIATKSANGNVVKGTLIS